MAGKKGGLGKGLDSLISNKVNTQQLNTGVNTEAEKADKMVKISKVEPNREQPRKQFDEESLNELAESIKQYGIIQPIVVCDKTSYYEIVAGERRWRAAKIAGLKEVPVIIREFTEEELVEIALIENIQREDLNPIEEAQAYKKMMDMFHVKQEDVAKKVSKSRAAVANSMRLLKLCEEVQQMIIDGTLSSGHARCLITIEDPEKQKQIAEQIIEQHLSVRETERLLKKLQKEQPEEKKTKEVDEQLQIIYANLAEQMKQILGTKVEIRQKTMEKGKIEIEYYSQEELSRLIELLKTVQS